MSLIDYLKQEYTVTMISTDIIERAKVNTDVIENFKHMSRQNVKKEMEALGFSCYKRYGIYHYRGLKEKCVFD